MAELLYDEMTREPLFNQGEPYTLRQFIKIAKKSAEGVELGVRAVKGPKLVVVVALILGAGITMDALLQPLKEPFMGEGGVVILHHLHGVDVVLHGLRGLSSTHILELVPVIKQPLKFESSLGEIFLSFILIFFDFAKSMTVFLVIPSKNESGIGVCNSLFLSLKKILALVASAIFPS